jgi:hypothetical protein
MRQKSTDFYPMLLTSQMVMKTQTRKYVGCPKENREIASGGRIGRRARLLRTSVPADHYHLAGTLV